MDSHGLSKLYNNKTWWDMTLKKEISLISFYAVDILLKCLTGYVPFLWLKNNQSISFSA